MTRPDPLIVVEEVKIPEFDIEIVQMVNLRTSQLFKATAGGFKEIVEDESTSKKPNQAAGGVKIDTKEEVKSSDNLLKPDKPINLFKKRKSPAERIPDLLQPILDERHRKEMHNSASNVFDVYEDAKMTI